MLQLWTAGPARLSALTSLPGEEGVESHTTCVKVQMA